MRGRRDIRLGNARCWRGSQPLNLNLSRFQPAPAPYTYITSSSWHLKQSSIRNVFREKWLITWYELKSSISIIFALTKMHDITHDIVLAEMFSSSFLIQQMNDTQMRRGWIMLQSMHEPFRQNSHGWWSTGSQWWPNTSELPKVTVCCNNSIKFAISLFMLNKDCVF